MRSRRKKSRSEENLWPSKQRIDDGNDKWRAVEEIYYGGTGGEVAERLDVIRECQLGLDDGKTRLSDRLGVYPMMPVATDRQKAAMRMLRSASVGYVHAT